MAHIVELTKSKGATSSAADDIKILLNADMIIKIEDTKEDYAGDTKLTMLDGSVCYVEESWSELKQLLGV